MPDVQNINLSKIIKRVELIKSLISLEEEDETGARSQTWLNPQYRKLPNKISLSSAQGVEKRLIVFSPKKVNLRLQKT